MSQYTHTHLINMEYARNQTNKDCPISIIESIATLKGRIDDSEKRIKKEGIVVRDMKGSVIAHPAIKISQDAIKLMVSLIDKH